MTNHNKKKNQPINAELEELSDLTDQFEILAEQTAVFNQAFPALGEMVANLNNLSKLVDELDDLYSKEDEKKLPAKPTHRETLPPKAEKKVLVFRAFSGSPKANSYMQVIEGDDQVKSEVLLLGIQPEDYSACAEAFAKAAKYFEGYKDDIGSSTDSVIEDLITISKEAGDDDSDSTS